jgi:hypothetical protein
MQGRILAYKKVRIFKTYEGRTTYKSLARKI